MSILEHNEPRELTYEEQLIPEALSMIIGVMRVHPQLEIHMRDADQKQFRRIPQVSTVEEFSEMFSEVFENESEHLLMTAREDLKRYSGVMHGSTDESTQEVFGDDPEHLLHCYDVQVTARKILDGLLIKKLDPVLSTTEVI